MRWNQRYLDEELSLIDRLQDELHETGLIRESGEQIVYEGNETLGTKPRTIYPYDYDFISYDFLKQILPQPELFELRQVLAIPKEDIEARHDYMLCVIKDRVQNADVYEREYFSKYPQYGYSRRKIGFSIDDLWEPKKKKYFPGRRRIMNSSTKCKHRPVHKIENRDRNIEPAVSTTPGIPDISIHHEPEIKGGLKALQQKGLKITYYKENIPKSRTKIIR